LAAPAAAFTRLDAVGRATAVSRFSADAVGPPKANASRPIAKKTSKPIKITGRVMDASSWLRGVERVRQLVLQAEVASAVPERRARDARADMPSLDLAAFVFAFDLEDEQIL